VTATQPLDQPIGQRPLKRIFISTGEVSGDLQGALLVAALHQQAQADHIDLEISALGGERMTAAGAKLLGDTTCFASIGFLEALPNILPTLRLQKQAQQYLQAHPPDLVVLIDYVGANKQMGSWIRKHYPSVPMVYYIGPQEWVWAYESRHRAEIRPYADRLLAIFPEEARYYEEQGLSVQFVGHPLLDRVAPSRDAARFQLGIPPEQVAILLSPASRAQELGFLLPMIFSAAQTLQAQIPQVHFWVPLALESFRAPIAAAIAEYGLNATIVAKSEGQVAIAAADLAITKSGTINLEMALLDVPQVVIYRLSGLTAWLLRYVLRIDLPFASPVNLVSMEPIVPELIQEAVSADRITAEVLKLIEPDRRCQMLADYARVRARLGEPGVCARAAAEIFRLLGQA
jgi:lipid-A-disaccharide synthase